MLSPLYLCFFFRSPSPLFVLEQAVRHVAFLLERQPKVGDVALVYAIDSNGQPCVSSSSSSSSESPEGGRRGQGGASPEVWYRDRAGAWNWVCSSLTAYWRLACVHLGVLGWQNAFAPQVSRD